jgi:hypothetical protein
MVKVYAWHDLIAIDDKLYKSVAINKKQALGVARALLHVYSKMTDPEYDAFNTEATVTINEKGEEV